MSSKKAITWQQLKDYCNGMPEDWLTKNVNWWGDERGGLIHSIHPLDEEYILSDEGYDPTSSYEPEQIEEYDLEDAERLPKGFPILYVD